MDDMTNVYNDKFMWLQHGVRKGWMTFHCAMHDGYYTPEEEALFEEYDDPCIPIYRFVQDECQP